MAKVRIATEWLAACAGCHMAVLDLEEKLLDVLEKCDIVYSPIIDVKEIPSNIDVALVTGAVRNEENRENLERLRKNSKSLIALGSCACFGGLPGLANLFDNSEIFNAVYQRTMSTANPEKVLPKDDVPALENRVYSLDQIVKVDYYLPGCPAPTDMIATALFDLLSGKEPELPLKNVCDECKLERKEKRLEKIKRPFEGIPKPDECLLDQGYVCLGPATRAGCGAQCIDVRMPCRGCMGPTAEVLEQGSKMISAIASVLEVEEEKVAGMVYDPAGMFYRFSLPSSIIKKNVRRK